MAGAPEVLAGVDDKTDGPAELPEVAAVVEVMAGLGSAVLTAAPPLSQGFGGEAMLNYSTQTISSRLRRCAHTDGEGLIAVKGMSSGRKVDGFDR